MTTVVRQGARPNNLDLAEQRIVHWHLTVEPGTRLEDVLEQSFWANVMNCMQPGHRVTLEAQDYSWIADLVVRWAHGTRADMQVLRQHEIDVSYGAPKLTDPEFADYDVIWGGSGDQYRVIRKSDNTLLYKNLATVEHTSAWLGEYAVRAAQ